MSRRSESRPTLLDVLLGFAALGLLLYGGWRLLEVEFRKSDLKQRLRGVEMAPSDRQFLEFVEMKRSRPDQNTDQPEDLLAGVPRGTGRTGTVTQSVFPTAQAIAEAFACGIDQLRPGLMLVGGVNGNERFIAVPNPTNTVIVAGSRAGKGVSHLEPMMQTDHSSLLVCDPKATLASYLEFRERVLGHDCHLVDPMRISQKIAHPYRTGFNIMAGVDPEDTDRVIDIAGVIADSIVKQSPRGEAHWDLASLMLLEGVAAHVMSSPIYEGKRNLGTVYDLVMNAAEDGDEDEPSTLEREMIESEAADGFIAASAHAHYDRHERERSSVLSTLRRHCDWLKYRRIRELLSTDGITPSKMLSRPTTVVVALPASRLGQLSPLLRLLINATIDAAELGEHRHGFQTGKGGHPLRVVIDEAASVGHMKSVEDGASRLPGVGVTFTTVLQDLAQARSIWSDRWETFIANSGVTVFFGNTDLTTLSHIEKRLGNTLVYTQSKSNTSFRSTVQDGATGSGFSVTTHPLLSVPEIARIFGRADKQRRQLVFVAGHDPMITERILSYEHPQLRGRVSREPT